MDLLLSFQYLAISLMFIAGCSPAILPKDGSMALSNSCELTKKSFVDSGLGTKNLHTFMTRDSSLTICSQDKTCCKREAEEAIHRQGMNSLKDMSDPLQQKLQHAFHNTSDKFVDFVGHLINNSYGSLDMMFRTTYQERYEANKHVFQDLFSMLQLYVTGDEVDLNQLCENFFALLYQKVYILFNPLSSYSDTYEACILRTADTIKPFGDGPRKVTLQISRSFLATRVFIEGLETGRSVVRELLKVQSGRECTVAFTKMLRCAGCSNLDGVKPCYKYCLNVMKGCYAYLSVVNKQWTDFISAMLKLAHKLEGPFSVESIIEPLGVKISEAIMVFQDHKDNITLMVTKSCGVAPMASLKDSLSSLSSSNHKSRKTRANFPFEYLGTGTGAKPTTAAGTNLDRLVRDAKASLEPLKDYWTGMAYNVCANGIAEDPLNDAMCWNGLDSSGYKLAVVNDGIPDMFQNPEVSLNISDPKIIVQSQVVKLKVMTSRILTALHGSDSNEVDVEEGSGTFGSGSGIDEGSGSGSGVLPTDPVPSTPTPTTMGNNVENINDVTTKGNNVGETTTESNEIPNSGNDVLSGKFPQGEGSTSGATHVVVSSVALLSISLTQMAILL